MKLRTVFGITGALATAAIMLPKEEHHPIESTKPAQSAPSNSTKPQTAIESIVAKAFEQAKEACADISDPTGNRECEAEAIRTYSNIELVKQCTTSSGCDTKQLSQTLSREI